MPISSVLANNIPQDVDHGTFPVPAPSTVAKQTVVLQLPPSWDYWWTLITDVNANLTQAMIQEIRVKANNKPIVTITGPDLTAENKNDKADAHLIASQILIPYGRFGILGGANLVNFPQAKLLSGASKDMALLSTLNAGSVGPDGSVINQVSIELDLVNTPVGAISLHCMSLATPPAPGGPGLIRRIEKKTLNAVVGKNIITRQNFSIGDDEHRFLNRLHFVTVVGALSAWEVRYNNNTRILRSSQEMLTMQGLMNARVGNALPHFFVDFCERGYGDEALFVGDAGTDLQLQVTTDTPEGIAFYQDSIGVL